MADSLLTGGADDPIVALDVATVAVPLERTIRLGSFVTNEREFGALRLRTASGLEGFALGYTRGLPLAEALLERAPAIVGRAATPQVAGPERILADGGVGVRAQSLIEIALWDIESKRAVLPLWRLLGGDRSEVAILAVGGYFQDQRTISGIEDELRELVAAGFTQVKVHAHDPVYIERLAAAVGDDAVLSIDLHMRFFDLDEAMRECLVLDELGLGFIEDPFLPSRPDLTAELAAALETPVAAGEDAEGEDALVALARAADLLRVDATASGGIAVALRAAAESAALGRPTMTHAFVELHAQIAGSSATISSAETIPYTSGANPVDRLLLRTQTIEQGMLVLSEEPGHGLAVDWNAVREHARFGTTLTPTEGSRWN